MKFCVWIVYVFLKCKEGGEVVLELIMIVEEVEMIVWWVKFEENVEWYCKLGMMLRDFSYNKEVVEYFEKFIEFDFIFF